eukprot:GEMP01042065.1.p1 GENE.GEMP01042065.1~~GEMP01042065.1.p1  ORF type:complete len:349 (+),score=68.46 GEMP01042065.1:18-1064(+)
MAYQCSSPWYKIALSICCCFGALVIYMHIDIALEGYGRTPTMAKEKWDAFYGPNAPGRFSHPEVDEQMDFLHQVLFVRLNISYSLSNGILLASLRHPNNCFPPYSNDVDIEITRSGGKLIETIAEAGTSHPLNRDGAIMLTRDMTPHTFSSPTCVKQATAALPQCGTPYPHLKIIVRARTHQYEPFVRNCKGQRVSPIVREEDLVRVDYQCDRCSWFGPIARVVGPQGSFRFSRTGDVVANNGMYTDIGESEHADTSFPETKMVQCNGIPARQWADDTYAAQIMEHSYGADYNEPLCVWWYFKWTCRKIPGMATVDAWGHLWLIKVVVETLTPSCATWCSLLSMDMQS